MSQKFTGMACRRGMKTGIIPLRILEPKFSRTVDTKAGFAL